MAVMMKNTVVTSKNNLVMSRNTVMVKMNTCGMRISFSLFHLNPEKALKIFDVK